MRQPSRARQLLRIACSRHGGAGNRRSSEANLFHTVDFLRGLSDGYVAFGVGTNFDQHWGALPAGILGSDLHFVLCVRLQVNKAT